MSIIHDALKKVQKSMEQNNTPINPFKLQEDIVEVLPSLNPKKKKNNSTLLWISIITSVLILFGFVLFIFSEIKSKNPKFLFSLNLNSIMRTQTHSSKTKITPTPTSSPVKEAAQTPTANTPIANAPPLSPSPTLDLQGIMASSGQNIALINNSVYEEGAVIDGKKIIKINLNTITIEYNGKQEEITLKK